MNPPIGGRCHATSRCAAARASHPRTNVHEQPERAVALLYPRDHSYSPPRMRWTRHIRERRALWSPLIANQRLLYTKLTTLRTEGHHQVVIKRSRFVGVAAHVNSEAAAENFVLARSDAKATHNAFAWRLADGSTRAQCDGEPSGTAGPPILNAIVIAGLHDVVALVTRYYGGVKLGCGGLMRAYGGTAVACLADASTAELQPVVSARVLYSAHDTGAVWALLGPLGLRVLTGEGSGGLLEATFSAPACEIAHLEVALRTATAGRVNMLVGAQSTPDAGRHN